MQDSSVFVAKCGAKEGSERVRMRKQTLLFPESYIMDSATVALRRSPEEGGEEKEEGKREGPSIFDKKPLFGQGQLLD